MDDFLKNPFLLVGSGAIVTWGIQQILNYLKNPSARELAAISAQVKSQGDVLTAALNNNTRVTEVLVTSVNDHESRVSVLEDFKARHDCKDKV